MIINKQDFLFCYYIPYTQNLFKKSLANYFSGYLMVNASLYMILYIYILRFIEAQKLVLNLLVLNKQYFKYR